MFENNTKEFSGQLIEETRAYKSKFPDIIQDENL